ncbi:endolytic transglycosylase MltG [Flavobacterium sp.]|uniref:endolytic transglycosylase MltG n=1 Tax=Flavobacterium sp. TaxID=239 RepID=UPI00260FB928|nr:endolytic transglycosylase MltG [Flavobacterium sp.]
MSKKGKILAIVSVVIVAVAIAYGYSLYSKIFSANTKFEETEVYVNIPSESDFEKVKSIMAAYVQNMETFEMVAGKKKYNTNVKSGRFLLRKGMNNNDIINSLRQSLPVNITFNNQERLEDFCARIASQIEADSLGLMAAITQEQFLTENNLTTDNVLSIFIPNSYEFFWDTDAMSFRNRMLKEHRKFWTPERLEKAKTQNLTPTEVYILASIVHKETVKTDERPRVAGVYLNRLKKGIKLEADPTVIYAVKKNSGDFTLQIKRVLNRDLATDNLYNTYKFPGLPPGPIAMPDISAIDAVLNPEKHDYIYFCASVSRFGYHEFAVTAAQHEVNRQKYVAWINAQGIKR